MTLYPGGMAVHGNVVSNGGSGPGRQPSDEGRHDRRHLIAQGWSGLWFGVIRSTIGGNVVIAKTAGTQVGERRYRGVRRPTN
jgi:hypothetical protein